MRNPLATYLAQARVTQAEFSRASGLPQPQVSLWCSGRRRPDVDNAFAIEEATSGAVPARAWRRKRSRKASAANTDT